MIITVISVLIILYFLLVLYRDLYLFPRIMSLCREKHIKLRVIFPILINKLDKYKIEYFIFSGTLLGYKRHNKKFIPWDDDIDLVLINTHDIREKLKKIGEELKEEKFTIIDDFFGHKFVDNSGVFIDLFIFEEKDNVIKSIYPKCLKFWPNEYFIKDETYPLFKDDFEGILVNVPKNYEKYLERQYGKYNEIELTYNHYLGFFHNKILQYIKFNHSASLKNSYENSKKINI